MESLYAEIDMYFVSVEACYASLIYELLYNFAMLSRIFKPESDKIKNAELIEFANVQEQKEKLNMWTIPPVNPETIYKYGMFQFKSSLAIKTMERTESFEDNDKIINLMEPREVLNHYREYKCVHIGLVQVAFKPLTLLGTDTSPGYLKGW